RQLWRSWLRSCVTVMEIMPIDNASNSWRDLRDGEGLRGDWGIRREGGLLGEGGLREEGSLRGEGVLREEGWRFPCGSHYECLYASMM
ncbi:hypothetical protein Tco_0021555, partial [Tanacetum coccineum]